MGMDLLGGLSSEQGLVPCDRRSVMGQHLQHVDVVVFVEFQPSSGTEHLKGWAFLPVPPEKVAVDPHVAFLEVLEVEVGVALFRNPESALGEAGEPLGRGALLPVENMAVDVDRVVGPLEEVPRLVIESE